MTVLNLLPSTVGLTSSLKATVSKIGSLSSGSLTIALRDNGHKVNGTLVAVDGVHGQIGETFNARNAKNKAPYGAHLVLGTVTFGKKDDGSVDVADMTVVSDLEITADTRLPFFTVKS